MNKILIILMVLGLVFFAACSSEEKEKPETPDTDLEEFQEEMEDAITADTLTLDDTEGAEKVADATDVAKKDPVAKSAAGDYTQNPLKGYIVSLKDVAFGSDRRINKSQAKELLDMGNTIGFKSGNNVYIVYHENGAYAGSQIHDFANRTTVGLYGKALSKNGVNAFIMTRVVSLD